MHRYVAIVFDLDGTLIDSYEAVTAAMNAARSAVGRPPLRLEQVACRVGEPLETLIAELVGEEVEQGVRRFRETYSEVFLDLSRALPRAAESVHALDELGLKLAVASNKPARFGRRLLEAFSMVPPIEIVLGPDEHLPPKPDPRMLGCALERLRVPPSRALYVGDVPLDLTTAARAGVDAALVATGGAEAARLRGRGAPVFDDLSGLVTWLKGRQTEMTSGQKARSIEG
jgi:phosphoglycolate phosphatase-like HAD superfamily hydrolase